MSDLSNLTAQELQLRLDELLSEEAKIKAEVLRKTKGLKDSRAKLTTLINDIELLRHCLVCLQEAESIEGIENQFLQILAIPFELSWVRILNIPDDQRFISDIETNIQATYLQTPLFRQNEQFGSIVAVKVGQINFTKSQVQLFSQLSDAISIAADRIQDTRSTEILKEDWQETFTALQHPVALIDKNYDLIQINQQAEAEPFRIQKKCYEYLFRRTVPCLNCQRGQKFFMDAHEKSYEVLSQTIQLPQTAQDIFVHAYIDITEERRIHKQMLETAKAAELGLIGSSIAHEINNPLGGLLSYIQLIKMDLSQETTFYQDVIELEKSAKRCVNIVRSLLEESQLLRSYRK